MKFVIRFHKQRWKSPTYKYELINFLIGRTSYILPAVIVYEFKIVMFGYEFLFELRRGKNGRTK